jgi:hypothetical protein
MKLTTGGGDGDYTTGDPEFNGMTFPNMGALKHPLSITITGNGSPQPVLALSEQGSMFWLGDLDVPVTMTIDNVTLQGLSTGHTLDNYWPDSPPEKDIVIPPTSTQDNNASLIYVGEGNTFDMLGNAQLTGNWNAGISIGTEDEIADSKIGGAVRVAGGTFRMTGDDTSVHHNYAALYGGGVYSIGAGGTQAQIIMAGENAEVSFNAVGTDSSSLVGGIVADGSSSDTLQASIFKMSGNHAKIRGNQGDAGGGIQVYGTGSTGFMSGTHAQISGNYSPRTGGGLRVSGTAHFTMSGTNAVISDNYAGTDGGGVHLYNSSTFTMSEANAVISGNYAGYDGGGVFAQDSTFIMEAGELSNNNDGSTPEHDLPQLGRDGSSALTWPGGTHGTMTGLSDGSVYGGEGAIPFSDIGTGIRQTPATVIRAVK